MSATNYARINWKDYPDTSTPTTAENLNKLDKGIYDLDQYITGLDVSAPSASGNAIAFIDSVSQADGKISATKKTVSTVSTSGAGLAPKVTDTSKFLKGDGTWATPTNTTYSVVSTSANGLAPKVTDTSKFLKGDGTWATPANTNNAVTQTATSTSANYEVLFSSTADNTTRTEGARKNSNLKFNPSTGNLQVTQLNGVTVGSDPKFTDTNTWRPVQNNLTSTSTSDALSANQGRLLANGSARDSTKLPLSGGTMTGSILYGGGDIIKGTINNGSMQILSATKYASGAHIVLRGSSQSGFNGDFGIFTGGDGTNYGPALIGTNIGALSWAGKSLLTDVFTVTGQIANGTGTTFTGVGTATVLCFSNGKAAIIYEYTVTANNNANVFTWGLNRDLLRGLNSNIPGITPVVGGICHLLGNYLMGASGSINHGISSTGFGYATTNSVNGQFWNYGRIYDTGGSIGGWPANMGFSVNDVFSGIAFGTY